MKLPNWFEVLRAKTRDERAPLVLLLTFQLICTVFFIFDVLKDVDVEGLASVFSFELLPEIGATLGLLVGMLFELRMLMKLRRKQADMAKGLSVAAGALDGLMQGYFVEWALTPAEKDVATFTIKGYSITEIAAMRASAEGTVKTHLNAIYRKAGVAGRAQLVSLLVEDLFRAPLLAQEPVQQAAE